MIRAWVRPKHDVKRLTLAALLLAGTGFHPTLPLPRDVYRYVFAVDITQSMNARDYHLEGWPSDRLSLVKETLRLALRELPCGSQAGLALFTTRSTLLLFEPLEVCEHYAAIDDAIAHIDWRMAWAADSYVAEGLFAALRDTQKLGEDTTLAFFTDGQQTPAQTETRTFQGKAGAVQGWLVGVGGLQPVPIPRLDQDNRQWDVWRQADVEPESAESDAPYLSRLDETALKGLAALTGLHYLRLETPQQLSAALRNPAMAHRETVTADVRWLLAALALGLLLSLWRQSR